MSEKMVEKVGLVDVGLMNVFEVAKETIDLEKYKKTREKYKMDNGFTLTPTGHRIITGKAVMLAKKVIKYGGTAEEIEKACINLYISMDAMKLKLDWAKYKRDAGIDLLVRKYAIKTQEEKQKK